MHTNEGEEKKLVVMKRKEGSCLGSLNLYDDKSLKTQKSEYIDDEELKHNSDNSRKGKKSYAFNINRKWSK